MARRFPRGADWVLCSCSASFPCSQIESRKLLPALNLPNLGVQDSYHLTISPGGNRIAAGFHWLPYIFIYDDQFSHLGTVRFEGENVRNFVPAGIPGVATAQVINPGTFSYITNITFINDHRYLIARAHKSGHYIFNLSEDQ